MSVVIFRCLLAVCLVSCFFVVPGQANEDVMKPENLYYEAVPKVVRADQASTITIRPLYDHVRFQADQEFEITCVATDGVEAPVTIRVKPEAGSLRFTYHFSGEQEHALVVKLIEGTETRTRGDFRVYSLREDLFDRTPFKGDLHMHSYRSDGVESPAYVAAACRRIGLDFMALTDHGQYAPSLEAPAFFHKLPVDLRIYPGEEVHPPDNPTHMINFGGSQSVNKLFAESAYKREVQELIAKLPPLPAGVDPYQYASTVWTFNKIREAGGLGVFCHPDWFSDYRYQLPQPLADYLLEQQPFDAYEVIGGYARWEAASNNTQVARYADACARGQQPAIVGVSDAHGCERGELFGWYYTVVFAPTTDLPDLIGSIKGKWSVAVEGLPGEVVRAFGPSRLVRYTQFLLREVFPQHDALCAQEGQLMLDYTAGKTEAVESLQQRQGEVTELYRKYWGK